MNKRAQETDIFERSPSGVNHGNILCLMCLNGWFTIMFFINERMNG
jgi:hypothetical protein